MFSGTGIRDPLEGGYLKPQELGLSPELIDKILMWLSRYENAHYMGYEDKNKVAELDAEGIEICLMLKKELPDSKIEYYSDAKLSKLPI